MKPEKIFCLVQKKTGGEFQHPSSVCPTERSALWSWLHHGSTATTTAALISVEGNWLEVFCIMRLCVIVPHIIW